MASFAKGDPTKEFFVDMLTRDISLNDAILDLLDNCLDGVLRSKPKKDSLDYYEGFRAEIIIAHDHFIIRDNCGGIPRHVAEDKAFRMGRPSGNVMPDNTPSVGIYGIGMKRAIFKIGRMAEVITKNCGMSYSVSVPSDWATTDSWDFPINEEPLVPGFICSGGTSIHIEKINDPILDIWRDEARLRNFASGLIGAIQQSYSLIIEKGFNITVNGYRVKSNPTLLLASEVEEGIKPFIYMNEYDGVKVKLAVGFYKPMPTADEIDDYNDSRRSSAEAGWTIVCNDRVILYNDKTFLSGWGVAGVPNYHTQFIGIKGIVFFESNDPSKLPMTTTKRGVDLASPIYSAVKEEMRRGLKLFINYTNQWKGRLPQEKEHSKKAQPVDVMDIVSNPVIQEELGVVPQPRRGAYVFTPTLPKPINEKDYVNVRFSRPREEVEFLSQVFFHDQLSETGASLVGEKCFELVYLARKGEKSE